MADDASPSTDATRSSALVVWAALIGNLLVALVKLIAAVVTGSTALLSEAVHSFVDTGNELLLLYGQHRAERLPDERFPFGHGREIYFWSFVVAILVFALGAGVALFKGVRQVMDPEDIEQPLVIYVVLALAALFEGISWAISVRAFRRTQGQATLWQALWRSKDPPNFMVLLEDSAALAGIAIAAGGTALADASADPRWDGAASILIGVLLAAVAFVLAAKTKDLLIGEQASPELIDDVLGVIRGFDGVERANGMITAQLAPDQVIAIASVAFDDALKTTEIEQLIERIEKAAVDKRPEIGRLFVKPQTPEAFAAAVDLRFNSGVTPAARERRRRGRDTRMTAAKPAP